MKEEKRAMWWQGNDTNKAKTQNQVEFVRNDKIRWVMMRMKKNKDGIGWLVGVPDTHTRVVPAMDPVPLGDLTLLRFLEWRDRGI